MKKIEPIGGGRLPPPPWNPPLAMGPCENVGYRELVRELTKHTDDKIGIIMEFSLIYWSDDVGARAELVQSAGIYR